MPLASMYNGCRDTGTYIFEMVKNSIFSNFLAHPVETPWPTWMAQCQNVRRSVPHADKRPHLTTLRKTETVDGSVALGIIRKTGITSLNFWPTL